MRIGLIKKKQSREEREEADFSDEGDELMSQALSVADPKEHDETVQPLTNSTMKVLEGLVDLEEEEITVLERSTDSSDDIFEDDIERDRDPDYVQPVEVPGNSRDTRAKGKALLKPTSTGGAKNTPSTSTSTIAYDERTREKCLAKYFTLCLLSKVLPSITSLTTRRSMRSSTRRRTGTWTTVICSTPG